MEEYKNNLFVCPECRYVATAPIENMGHICPGIQSQSNNFTGFVLKPSKKPIPINS